MTRPRNKRQLLKRISIVLLVIVVLTNVIAFNHAWRFTHYNPNLHDKIDYEELSLSKKIEYGILGVSAPRQEISETPELPYQTVHIKSSVLLEGWHIPNEQNKGTILMLHGYISCKTSHIAKAGLLHDMGYNILMVDFMGSGGSEGNDVTIGYKESKNVLDCYNYLTDKGAENIILFGTSMGAAASMKAIQDHNLNPTALIIEAPFGTLLQAVKNRFDIANAPYFPMAYLLVFWGGMQHGFNAFKHSPIQYAKSINCPTLIIYGAKDDRVLLEEEQAILTNLNGEKKLVVYPNAAHDNYLQQHKEDWVADVSTFLRNYVE